MSDKSYKDQKSSFLNESNSDLKVTVEDSSNAVDLLMGYDGEESSINLDRIGVSIDKPKKSETKLMKWKSMWIK